jgi:hypothetical protein
MAGGTDTASALGRLHLQRPVTPSVRQPWRHGSGLACSTGLALHHLSAPQGT